MNLSLCQNLSCCDYVTVTDNGAQSSQTPPLCGFHTGSKSIEIHANGDTLTVLFVSDGRPSGESNGFRLSYRQEKVVFTSPVGVVRSPNYGQTIVSTYPDNLNISWRLNVTAGHHIRVQFAESFHVEGEVGHCVDSLNRGSGLLVGMSEYSREFCGRVAPAMYYTLSNQAWFQLLTDDSERFEGFELRYTAERRVFTEPEGVLTSPLYPENFPSPIYTKYAIQAPAGYRIHVEVHMFDIPGCSTDDNGFCEHCPDDGNYLEVVSEFGRGEKGLHLSKRYCNGMEPRQYLMSVDDNLKVVFNSAGEEDTGRGFRISYHFVMNRLSLQDDFPTEVIFASIGYETMGVVYYEVVVPKGHNLGAFHPHLKLDCNLKEYIVFAHSLEDIENDNSLVICTDGGENMDTNKHLLWVQPQSMLGTGDWSMMVLIYNMNFIDSDLSLSFWPDNPVLKSNIGILYGLRDGYLWASYRDKSKGAPYTVSTAMPATCNSIKYKVFAAPNCSSDAEALLRSPYNVPYGLDKSICKVTEEWVEVDGNLISLVWTPSQSNDSVKHWVVVAYQIVQRYVDCSFDIDMCNWSRSNHSYTPVMWRRTSMETMARSPSTFLRKQLMEMNGKIWNTGFSDYYMHVRMDAHFPGEKAQMRSPLMPAGIGRTLSFKYHMHGSNVGHLNVYTWSPNEDYRWRLVWSRHGASNTTWQHADGIHVAACYDFYVIFEATIPRGSLSVIAGDIAVDNIFFCEYPEDAGKCSDTACGDNGKCMDTVPSTDNAGASHECCCDDGYTGSRCETRLDLCSDGSLTCLNQGTCLTWQTVGNASIAAVCSCVPGYAGLRCEEEVDECASNPCSNGARCIDGLGRYHCVCPLHSTGTNCELDSNVCNQQPCTNGGTCVNFELQAFRCICAVGFIGYTCEQEINECSRRPCLHNGLCVDLLNDFQCACEPGYAGKRCEMNINSCADALEQGLCHNGGSCVDTVNGFTCRCVEGWQGTRCDEQEDDCLAQPCVNNARCVDRHRDFQCICPQGYHGKRCEHVVDLCADNNCVYGFCLQNATGHWCDCLPGYTGELCEENINRCKKGPCAAGSTCVTLPDASFYCSCPPGRSGPTCSTNADHCENVNSCLNGGTCVSLTLGYRCDCPLGFRGHMCEYEASGCEGRQCVHGVCLDQAHNRFQCRCAEGWSGTHCDIEAHAMLCDQLMPCNAGSTCVTTFNGYICVCAVGYAGTHCEIEVDECESNPCLNSGQCVDDVNSWTCNCSQGYRGKRCEEQIHPCEYLHCFNGVCTVNEGGFVYCNCYPGYEGLLCVDAVDHCVTSLCHQSAVCHNLIDDYYCECNPSVPLQGERCDEPIQVCPPNVCYNGGVCKSEGFTYSCQCPPNTQGADCSLMIRACDKNPCKHGSCIDLGGDNYKCMCDAGWTQPECDELEYSCSTYKCMNGGTCFMHSDGKPFCVCQRTYTGPRCDMPVDPCWTMFCYHGGSCKVGGEGFLSGMAYCDCAEGYDGQSCEIDMTTGSVIGGFRTKRDLSENLQIKHNNVTNQKMDGRNSTYDTFAAACHPLGNETSLTTKWILMAITLGLYIIVILSAVTYTVIILRIQNIRYADDYLNESSLCYYTPPVHKTPVRKRQTSFFRTNQ